MLSCWLWFSASVYLSYCCLFTLFDLPFDLPFVPLHIQVLDLPALLLYIFSFFGWESPSCDQKNKILMNKFASYLTKTTKVCNNQPTSPPASNMAANSFVLVASPAGMSEKKLLASGLLPENKSFYFPLASLTWVTQRDPSQSEWTSTNYVAVMSRWVKCLFWEFFSILSLIF